MPLQAPNQLQTALRRVATAMHVSATPVIFTQGEPSRGIYLIEKGEVRFSLRSERDNTVFERNLGSGSLLGLPATINNAPYSATATAVQDSELAFVSRDDLLALMRREPMIAMSILQLLSQEIHDMREVIVHAR